MPSSTDTASPSSRIAHLVSQLAAWWHNGPRQFGLNGVSEGEVSRMAHDLGLSPGDLTRLAARDEDASLLLYSRLERLGLTKDDIENAGFRRDLERTCGLCPDKDICQHDLDMRRDGDDWKIYCPNRYSLESVQAGKQARSNG